MTPQEASEQYALKFKTQASSEGLDNIKDDFLAGQKWQSEQDNQALSSALKEIAELNSWKKEMLQIWNKLDSYIETRADIKLGVSKVDFAIQIMKDQTELREKIKDLESKPNNFM